MATYLLEEYDFSSIHLNSKQSFRMIFLVCLKSCTSCSMACLHVEGENSKISAYDLKRQ